MPVTTSVHLRSHQSTLLGRLGAGWRAFAVPGPGTDKAVISRKGAPPLKIRRSTLTALGRRGFLREGPMVPTRFGEVMEFVLTDYGREIAKGYN